MAEIELTKAQKILNRLKHLEEIRQPTIDACKDITQYVAPGRGKYLSMGETAEQKKKSKYTKIIKNTAGRALRILQAGMQTGLTNPARPWIRFGLQDKDLAEYGPVRVWLDTSCKIILRILDMSNFYACTHSIYGELGAFATACLYIEEDPISTIRGRIVTMGEYVIALDASGRVNLVGRHFYMTARQMKEKWDNKVSQDVKNVLMSTSGHDKKFQVVHWVQPNKDRDITKADNGNMPWSSTYFQYDKTNNDAILEQGGYEEFPFMVPRWDVLASDEWGNGPGMEILADTKMMQEIEKASIKAMHKTLDPPMFAPAGLKNKFRMQPGSVNFYDVNTDKEIGPLYQINFDIASAEAKTQEIVRDIKEGFFNDLFLMIAQSEGTQPFTATEILERREEKMTVLGPVVDRSINELLRPAIDRVWNIAVRTGRIPPPPPEIAGEEFEVEFISLLAQAQKLQGVHPIQATINYALSLSEIKPDIVDKVDLDQSVDEYAAGVGAPAKIIRSDADVAELRKARAEEQRKMQEMAELQAGLEMGKTASEIDTGGDNALTGIAKAIGG